ncbi:MAG: PQQ-dependent sugar dehydrogenase [Lentisphaeraceae bacterium]|nr:PQQ-dependent sugar dehydrogenase [Lentisphaeraceae bacterium]
MRFITLFLLILVSVSAREANTTLNFPAELTSAYQVQNAFNNLSFSSPVALRTPPGEESLYVVEKIGRVYLLEDLGSPQKQLVLDISQKVESGGEQGLLSIAFHPNFRQNNTFYAFYTTRVNNSRHQLVSRFVITEESSQLNTPYTLEETVLIQQNDRAGNHNGGDMHFGPDGYLYISLGDEGSQNDFYNNSQKIDKNFFSGILRIDVDRKAENLEPNPHTSVVLNDGVAAYKIPADNPWVGATQFNNLAVDADSVITEFWSVGFRNPWRMSFDSQGNLWIADVGQVQREEIDFIEAGVGGTNFGWNYREAELPGPRTAPNGLTFDEAIYSYVRTNDPQYDGRSVTGGVVYENGSIESLKGTYIFSDHVSGNIWSLTKNGTDVSVEYIANNVRISAFGIHPVTSEILICDYATGQIKTITESVANEGDIPETLTATGAFSDVLNLTPEAGVEHYAPNVNFWSDYAIKTRWFSLPNISDQFSFNADGSWGFPAGTVWVKHFDLEMERGNPASKKRVETRFLVKTEEGAYGLAYQWNDSETEATLVPSEGASIEYEIDIDGVPTLKTWNIPGRSDCMQCHLSTSSYALSFNTKQLNKAYDIFGKNQNILTGLYEEGYLDENPGNPDNLQKLYPADDTTATLDQKVRSYLDVNCSYCHQEGGPTPAEFSALVDKSLAESGFLEAPLNNGGDNSRRLILPGNPDKSVILSRMQASDGFPRMPPIATSELDHGSIDLVRDWILSLNETPEEKDPYQPDASGLVSIEAENADSVTTGQNNHDWVLVSEAEATGGSAYYASPDSGVNQNTNYTTLSPRLDYQVNFDRAGTFHVWVRGHSIQGLSGRSDSVHVGLNGAAVASADRINTFTPSYGWSESTMDGIQATIEVPSAGVHTVNVWMREDGFTFDKLVLTPDDAFVPVADGPHESVRGTLARKVTVSIDPYHPSNWDMFQATISNESTTASVESIKLNLLGSGNFDRFESSQFTVSPNLGGNNDQLTSQEVTLSFTEGLAPGSSVQNGINNNRSDIDGNFTGFEVTVRFTDGYEMTGEMTNITDSDDGDTEFWQVVFESDNEAAGFISNYQFIDIGNSSVSVVEENGEFNLTAAGSDIWNTSDEFGFAYMEWEGDVTLVAQVNSLAAVHAWTKSGVMIRETLEASSKHASSFATSSRASAHWRPETGERTYSTNIIHDDSNPPMWVKLTREGNIFRSFYSLDGGVWHPNGQRTIEMASKVYVGLALTSHQAGITTTANISNVEVKRPDSEIYIRRLVLINNDSQAVIRNLNDRLVIDSSSLGTSNLNILADINDIPGSVEFKLNGVLQDSDNSEPFNFFNDGSWSPAPGVYILEATPTSEGGAQGVRGETIRVTITIQ